MSRPSGASAAGSGAAGAASAPKRLFPERFAQVAAAHPDRAALVTDGEQLTYGELDRRSAEVARGLAGRGLGAESVVALGAGRDAGTVVGLLGILRAGAAYLPLEPTYPPARSAFMLGDSRATIIVAGTEAVGAALAGLPAEVASTAGLGAAGRRTGGTLPPIDPRQLAYVVYTSGSTGRPKGVGVAHGSLAALLNGLEGVVGAQPARLGWNASLSFDASVQQWARLGRGDTLALVSEDVRSDPAALCDFIARHRLDELDITPSHLRAVVGHLRPEATARGLRLLVGGEALDEGLWGRLAAWRRTGALEAVNVYGPTETTVDATAAPIDDRSGPHLGEPLPGVSVHVLDEGLRPVGPGAVGELFLAGPGVARGYLGHPGLTAERFLPDAVANDGSRMYRTGDRARVGRAGRLVFVGRADDQVKVRGHRVELGEVENVLCGCPGVAAAVAVFRRDLPGGAGVAAYCRLRPGHDIDSLRATLAERLPGFMVPDLLVALDDLPATSSGKADREALRTRSLPAPGPAPEDRAVAGFIAPTGRWEALVAETWSEVLGAGGFSADAGFFDLGGNSVLAIRVIARLRRVTGLPIPMVTAFEHPQLRDLAACISGLAAGEPVGAGR